MKDSLDELIDWLEENGVYREKDKGSIVVHTKLGIHDILARIYAIKERE